MFRLRGSTRPKQSFADSKSPPAAVSILSAYSVLPLVIFCIPLCKPSQPTTLTDKEIRTIIMLIR